MAKMGDTDAITDAYNDVRSDDSSTNWCCLKYGEGETLELESKGEDFEELKSKLEDSERVYAFLRIQTGDEMSKRAKFVFIQWVGCNVSAMKKAKMSTEKAFVKKYWPNFAKEMNIDEIGEFTEEHITEEVKKAGGANYGTGQ